MSDLEQEPERKALRFCSSCRRSETITGIPQWIGPQQRDTDNGPLPPLCYECMGRLSQAAYTSYIEQERAVDQERARHRQGILRQLRQGSSEGPAGTLE